jgi:acetyl-CoA carboxylase carboxyl transferase subunit beta
MTDSGDAIAVSVRRRDFDGIEAVAVEWDFTVHGGTFGRDEADAFVAACADAATTATPLVTILRSGGTRLQEGMRALVGIPRAMLALRDLAAAGVPHVSVADHPTTGGVWVAFCSRADVRVGVAGATVGFSGPRVVTAMTGEPVPAGANTAESAYAAGLLDDVVPAPDLDRAIARSLRALRTTPAGAAGEPPPSSRIPDRHGWDQVVYSREVDRPSGRELAAAVLDHPMALRGGDDTVDASVGRLGALPAIVVAVAAERAARVSPAGYHLLSRAAGQAGRLGLPLVTLVDTAGADPVPASEDAGIAPAIAEAMAAVIDCTTVTIAVVHGEGGSGGALAAAVCDIVAVTDAGWFAALAPEGAAAALRRPEAEAAELMRVAPAELIADGFADAIAPADPPRLRDWLQATLSAAAGTDPAVRRTARERRWREPLTPRSGNG